MENLFPIGVGSFLPEWFLPSAHLPWRARDRPTLFRKTEKPISVMNITFGPRYKCLNLFQRGSNYVLYETQKVRQTIHHGVDLNFWAPEVLLESTNE